MGGGASKTKEDVNGAGRGFSSDIPETPFTRKYEMDMTDDGKLGEGSYAVVRKGWPKEDPSKVYAIKCVDKQGLSEPDLVALQDEVQILGRCKHPNVMGLAEFFDEEDFFYLITEMVAGGELFDRIVLRECYTEADAAQLVRIFLQTLEYLHANSIVHRDLKPENLLLKSEDDDHEITLADFGYAATLSSPTDTSLTDQCGTPGYVAPEIIKSEPYGTKVDMWSAGVIIFILLGGYPPFGASEQGALYEMIKKGNYEFEEDYWGHISNEAKDLISKLLNVDPVQRLSAPQALQHVWLNPSSAETTNNLGKNLNMLKTFNAKRKMKATIKTVIMSNRLMGAFGGKGNGKTFLENLKETQAKEEKAAELAASLPDLLDKDKAREIAGEMYDDDKFEELKDANGVVTKAQFMEVAHLTLGVVPMPEEAAAPPAEASNAPAVAAVEG